MIPAVTPAVPVTLGPGTLVLAAGFGSFMLYLALGLAALAVTAALDRSIGKERALFAWSLVVLAVTWFLVKPAVPEAKNPKPATLSFAGDAYSEDPTQLPAPGPEPFARTAIPREGRNAFMPQSDTTPLPPERLPEPPAVALPFPLPPTIPGPGPAERRSLRGTLPATKTGDGTKLVDVPADAQVSYASKPEDVFDWIVQGGNRYYVYILAVDGVREGSPEFERLKWALALQDDRADRPWKEMTVKFAAVGLEDEAKTKVAEPRRARRERVQEIRAGEHDRWFLRRSVANLDSEACRHYGAAEPKDLPVERLLDVARDMSELGRSGKEDGEGWRKAREALEVALEKSERSPGRDSSDVLLALIETYRAVHDERAILATLARYQATVKTQSRQADAATWLGDVFLGSLGLPIEARTFYDRAIAASPAAAAAHLGEGDAYTRLGEHRKAAESYRRALESGARTEAAVREAEALLRAGQLSDALGKAQAALSASAYDPRALLVQGAILYAQGDVAKARESFAQASALPGDGPAGVAARHHRAEALYDLGLAEWRLGHGDAAAAAFEACDRALRTGAQRGRTPDETIATDVGRALLQASEGNLPQASETLERSREQAPTVSYAEAFAGWLAWTQGDVARARSRFEAALALEPGYAELDGWISDVRLALAQGAVRAGVPPAESAAHFEAARRFAQRAAEREARVDPKSTDYAVREALVRVHGDDLTERHRFTEALATAEAVLSRSREERRALAIKGYCNYRLGASEPDRYAECIRNFTAVVEVTPAADDPWRVYAADCLKRVKHWQSLEQKVVDFETRLSSEWQTSESSGIRIFPDDHWLHVVDSSKSGASGDGSMNEPTVFARNDKLFDKQSFERMEILVSVPPKNRAGENVNGVTFGVLIQTGGTKKGASATSLGIFYDKGKVAARLAGSSEPYWKDGEVKRLKTKDGADVDWPDDGNPVRLEIERTKPEDGSFTVRLNGEEVLGSSGGSVLPARIPALKESKGPLDLWLAGWSTTAQHWDLRLDDLRIVRKKSS